MDAGLNILFYFISFHTQKAFPIFRIPTRLPLLPSTSSGPSDPFPKHPTHGGLSWDPLSTPGAPCEGTGGEWGAPTAAILCTPPPPPPHHHEGAEMRAVVLFVTNLCVFFFLHKGG